MKTITADQLTQAIAAMRTAHNQLNWDGHGDETNVAGNLQAAIKVLVAARLDMWADAALTTIGKELESPAMAAALSAAVPK